jgi:hypothetical protein
MDQPIDLGTGAIRFERPETAVTSALTRQQFLASELAAGAGVFVDNEPWVSYRVPSVTLGGGEFIAVLFFKAQDLTGVDLFHPFPDEPGGWENWSEERELGRRAFHDEWLASIGVEGLPHKYSWGWVRSFFDERAGSSSIAIRYEPAG